jgi:hypothetical protein
MCFCLLNLIPYEKALNCDLARPQKNAAKNCRKEENTATDLTIYAQGQENDKNSKSVTIHELTWSQ